MTNSTDSTASAAAAPGHAAGRGRAVAAADGRPQVLSTTIRSRASRRRSDASGAQPWDIDLFYDLAYNLFVTGRRAAGDDVRAGNINTIDEVPDSSWFTNRIGIRADDRSTSSCAGPTGARRRRAGQLDRHARRAPGSRRVHRARRQGPDLVRLVRRADQSRGRHRRRSWSPPSSSGRSATTRSRTSSPTCAPTRVDIDPKATQAPPSGQRTPFTHDDVQRGARARAHRTPTAPTAPRPAACCRARCSAASSTRARGPTTRTTSCRTSTGASCGRCASSARGRTSPT